MSKQPELIFSWCEALFKKYDVKLWPNTGKAEKPALSPGPSLEHFGLDVKGSNESKLTIGEISPM